jgi:hypothetical protein
MIEIVIRHADRRITRRTIDPNVEQPPLRHRLPLRTGPVLVTGPNGMRASSPRPRYAVSTGHQSDKNLGRRPAHKDHRRGRISRHKAVRIVDDRLWPYC